MMKERILIPALCLSLMSFGVAEAQANPRTSRIAPKPNISNVTAPRISASRSSRAPRIAAPRGMVSSRRPDTSLSGSRSRAGQRPLGNTGLRGLDPRRASGAANSPLGGLLDPRRTSGAANSPLGGLLEQYLYNEYGGGRHRYDPYAGEKAHAKAYRDAAIANAVVNVVGILATANRQQQIGVCDTPAAPRGHVEQQRVLVREGRTEEYQVWVPEYTIPSTGEIVAGHHETRRREIPPVYETREVWIPSP